MFATSREGDEQVVSLYIFLFYQIWTQLLNYLHWRR